MFLIPISHEDQKVIRVPWVTIALIAVNVAIFLMTHSLAQRQSVAVRTQIQEVLRFARAHPYLKLPEQLEGAIPARRPPAELSPEVLAEQQAQFDRMLQDLQATTSRSVFRTYGYVPAQKSALTLFTSMFMHGGWLHLIGNMFFLWLTGTSLEDKWGRLLFLILYLASGVAGTLIHGSVHPESTVPMVGASGAIAGLMGAFLVRLTTTRIRFFYWIYFIRGTFHAPAYVVLPLWLFQQFAMAGSGQTGGVAVWAHIGGFGLGVAAALLIQGTNFEARFLAPSIRKKTSWSASERLGTALRRFDKGDVDGAIKDLQALLRVKPESIEARTPLIAAYESKGDHAAAGKESARLVRGYLSVRDMEGALAAAKEHDRTYREVPLFMRELLALAAHQEKLGQHAEAAQLYQKAIAAWPNDPLAPKALVAYGRSMLQTFNDPRAALEYLERARAHPNASPEIQTLSDELLTEAREALGPVEQPPQVAPPPADEPSVPEPPTPPPPQELVLEELSAEAAPAPAPAPIRSLVAVSMQAVGIDGRGLQLQSRTGGSGRLPWQQVVAVSVASIGMPDTGAPADSLILDLLMSPKSTPEGAVFHAVRLSPQDLAIPQLQTEPSPVRAFQRFVATVLKTTGAVPHPSRDACLGLRGFPNFSDLAAYEADLLVRLPSAE
jgi:membrane associated rhomboid family serine protease/Tfp pilus assembly protein PilF